MVVNKGNTQWRQRESRQVKHQDCWKDKWMDGQIGTSICTLTNVHAAEGE